MIGSSADRLNITDCVTITDRSTITKQAGANCARRRFCRSVAWDYNNEHVSSLLTKVFMDVINQGYSATDREQGPSRIN